MRDLAFTNQWFIYIKNGIGFSLMAKEKISSEKRVSQSFLGIDFSFGHYIFH